MLRVSQSANQRNRPPWVLAGNPRPRKTGYFVWVAPHVFRGRSANQLTKQQRVGLKSARLATKCGSRRRVGGGQGVARICLARQVRSSNPAAECCASAEAARLPCDSPQNSLGPAMAAAVAEQEAAERQPRPPQMSLSPPLRGTSRSLSSLLAKRKSPALSPR